MVILEVTKDNLPTGVHRFWYPLQIFPQALPRLVAHIEIQLGSNTFGVPLPGSKLVLDELAVQRHLNQQCGDIVLAVQGLEVERGATRFSCLPGSLVKSCRGQSCNSSPVIE